MEVNQSAIWTHTERKYSEVQLTNGLQMVRQRVNSIDNELRALEGHVKTFSLQQQEISKNKVLINCLQQAEPMTAENSRCEAYLRDQNDEIEKKLNAMEAFKSKLQIDVVDQLKENITHLRHYQSQVLDEELIKWKREQQLSGNGVPMQSNLNTIQEWCELLADLVWSTRQQVGNVARINGKTLPELRQPHLAEMLDDMSKQVTSLLSTLVTSTFVIEKQPPQVMKTRIRFTATVRLLVGGQLNVHMTPPRVTVVIISEQQAQLLLKSASASGRGKQPVECGDILNNSGCMEYQPTSRQLSVSFRNLQLRKISRPKKMGAENVTDEKLTLLFQSEFNVGGGELVFQVWTLSLPVVVIVHGNQEVHGWATITWDNAFSPPARVPFMVPDKVSWGQVADTLRIKFRSATGGDLTEDNLRYLAEKLFRKLPQSWEELCSMTVSWSKFCKDTLPEEDFTFWEWFYMVLKLTGDHLKGLWRDRLIMGFIGKRHAESLLVYCLPGTFLLRFSDTNLGAISIAWVEEGYAVYNLQPLNSKDLMQRSLPDRISDLEQLQFLYPNVAKDDVFSKYYTKPDTEKTSNGYVKPMLKTKLVPYRFPPLMNVSSPDSHRSSSSVDSSYFSAATPTQSEGISLEVDYFERFDMPLYRQNANMN